VAEDDMTEPHGTIGDEAAKLLDAVQDWARRNLGDAATSHIATGAPECTWCPICQFIAVLRGDRPELTDKITEAGLAVAAALRAVLDTAPGRPPGQPSTHVQHIDLDSDREGKA
jgi:hypothetical protein